MPVQRISGILLHPTSLPGPFGIGDIGPEAERFLDWMVAAGQQLWQVLPLAPTGYGDSPYAPFSTFAGNELLISPTLLADEGLLTQAELDAAGLPQTRRVDYGAVIPAKRSLIRMAADRLVRSGYESGAFAEFRVDNAFWLDDYALFMDIKEEYDARARAESVADSSWNKFWPEPLARRERQALDQRREQNESSLARLAAVQFMFSRQWAALRRAAERSGIRIMGDLPIFVAMDSADAWARPELFNLDAVGNPIEIAGVPPDYFSADGQLWGNPLYAWERHRAEHFAWWIERVRASLALYDLVRIDHFRGLCANWAVPAGEATARHGHWKPAPGEELLSALAAALGQELPIVAEDLGFITADVSELRERFGLPGMRILQFGFDSRESGKGLDPANPFLPHNYTPDCVAYTGTHDNDTLAGWLSQARREELDFILEYLGYTPGNMVWALIREAMKSAAGMVILPMQDVLGLGSDARMNQPGTSGGNWAWRADPASFDPELARRLRSLSSLYGRDHQGA
ncbi:MAG TPA: 4-alpha-glucanotransferase [bacterium]|nr:4-alpha-glucanotransferase [bacterium]